MATIYTSIDAANTRIAELEAKVNASSGDGNSGGVLTWLRKRFGEPTEGDHSMQSKEGDKPYDDDEDDDDDDDDMRGEVSRLTSELKSLKENCEADAYKISALQDDVNRLGAHVRILTERLGGDHNPKSETGSASSGSLEAQLTHHLSVQSGMDNWRDRQAYGRQHIVPLQKKLGVLQA